MTDQLLENNSRRKFKHSLEQWHGASFCWYQYSLWIYHWVLQWWILVSARWSPMSLLYRMLEFPPWVVSQQLICRRTDVALPAHSPDLSPLDCWFWVTMERIMYLRPSNTSKLWKNDKWSCKFAMTTRESKVRRAVANINCQVQLCSLNNGVHFEAEI